MTNLESVVLVAAPVSLDYRGVDTGLLDRAGATRGSVLATIHKNSMAPVSYVRPSDGRAFHS